MTKIAKDEVRRQLYAAQILNALIPHVTVQFGTVCCHAETVHCDLESLLAIHQQ